MGRTFELQVKATREPTKLVDLDIRVAVSGFLAKTTVTMVFKNETAVETEGELIFPLPDGAAMCAYAVDINGALVDGVVIEKEKARVVFEAEARKVTEKPQVSIAEAVVGNIFKTRIFPLPKDGTRAVRVSYVEELLVSKDALPSATYELPLEFPTPIEAFSLGVSVEVSSSEVKGTPSMKDLPLSQRADDGMNKLTRSFIWYRKTNNQQINSGVFITIPQFQQIMVVDMDPSGDAYFALRHPPLEEVTGNTASPKKRIALLWDGSKSRQSANLELEYQAIAVALSRLNSEDAIDVIVFRDTTDTPMTFYAKESSRVISYLRGITYDGGSNLGGLQIRKASFDDKDLLAYYLMFTDGVHTLGVSNTPSRLGAPIYLFSSSEQANHNLLRIWARKSGGEYFKLSPTSVLNTVLSNLGKESFSYISAEFDEKLVREVYPSVPTSTTDFTFKFAGIIPKSKTTISAPISITFNYGYGTKVTRQIRCEVHVPKTGQPSSENLAVRFWAQRKIDELGLFPDVPGNKELITKMGQTYSIVTENTSFIVLESLDAYIKYEIEPPLSLPEIHRDWHLIMKKRMLLKSTAEEEAVLDVIDFWRRRIAWWNEDLASPEAKEEVMLHFLKFGDGVDQVRDVLGAEWANWRERREAERQAKEWRSRRLQELMTMSVTSLESTLTEISEMLESLVSRSKEEYAQAEKMQASDRILAAVHEERSLQIRDNWLKANEKHIELKIEVSKLRNISETHTSEFSEPEFERLFVWQSRATQRVYYFVASLKKSMQKVTAARDLVLKLAQLVSRASIVSVSDKEVKPRSTGVKFGIKREGHRGLSFDTTLLNNAVHFIHCIPERSSSVSAISRSDKLPSTEVTPEAPKRPKAPQKPALPIAATSCSKPPGELDSLLCDMKLEQGAPFAPPAFPLGSVQLQEVDDDELRHRLDALKDQGPPPPPPPAYSQISAQFQRPLDIDDLIPLSRPQMSGLPPPPPAPAPCAAPAPRSAGHAPPPPGMAVPMTPPATSGPTLNRANLLASISAGASLKSKSKKKKEEGIKMGTEQKNQHDGTIGMAHGPLGTVFSKRGAVQSVKGDVAETNARKDRDSGLSDVLFSRRAAETEEEEADNDDDGGDWEEPAKPLPPAARAPAPSSVPMSSLGDSFSSRGGRGRGGRGPSGGAGREETGRGKGGFGLGPGGSPRRRASVREEIEDAAAGAAAAEDAAAKSDAKPPLSLFSRFASRESAGEKNQNETTESNTIVSLLDEITAEESAKQAPLLAKSQRRPMSPPARAPAPEPMVAPTFSEAPAAQAPPAKLTTPASRPAAQIPVTQSAPMQPTASLPARPINAPIVASQRQFAEVQEKLKRTADEVERVKAAALDNIDKILARGEMLESLDERSEELASESLVFKSRSGTTGFLSRLANSIMPSIAQRSSRSDSVPPQMEPTLSSSKSSASTLLGLFGTSSRVADEPEKPVEFEEKKKSLLSTGKLADRKKKKISPSKEMFDSADWSQQQRQQQPLPPPSAPIPPMDQYSYGGLLGFDNEKCFDDGDIVDHRIHVDFESHTDEPEPFIESHEELERYESLSQQYESIPISDSINSFDWGTMNELVSEYHGPSLSCIVVGEPKPEPKSLPKEAPPKPQTVVVTDNIPRPPDVLMETITVKTEHQTYHIIANLKGTVGELQDALSNAQLVPKRFLRVSVDGNELVDESQKLTFYCMDHKSIINLSLNTSKDLATEDDKISVGWAEWRMKQPVNWQAFEGRSGLSKSDPGHMVLFHKWQEDRFILLQRRMQMQFGDIEKEFRRTMFLRAATDSHGANTRITILPWLPKGEYADVLQAGSTAKAVYDAYLSQRNSTPMFSKLYSFYADAAQLVSGRGDQRLAQRILSNLAELDLDDPQPLRMMAFRLEANNQLDAAVGQYRRILVMRPEEPQSHRDLSIALARQANTMMERARGTHVTVAEEDELQGQAIERYTEAIQLLTKVILGKWDARFHQIQITALADLNRLVNFTKFYGLNHLHACIDKRLLGPVDVDLRVCVQWDTDMTDVELHVTEPTGEKCYAWNNKTKIGGMLSKDFSKGYGPEEYLVKCAIAGSYQVRVKLFASLERIGGTTCKLHVYTNFGRPGQEREEVQIVRLHKVKEIIHVANVSF